MAKRNKIKKNMYITNNKFDLIRKGSSSDAR